MDTSNNFLFHLKYDDDYNQFLYSGDLNNLKEVYIICNESFSEQNVNISNLVHNIGNMKIPNITRLNFSLAEIMSFKTKKSDFYILSKGCLENILKKKGINIEYKLLFFQNESGFLYFNIKNKQLTNINNPPNIFIMNNNDINQSNNLINNNENAFDKDNNIINNITNNSNNIQNFNSNFQNNENNLKIIRALILLYGNEKITNELYSKGSYDLKNFYLVDKSWINKFKKNYFYNEIYNILQMKGIKTYQDALNNLQILETSNEISAIINKMNIQANTQIEYGLSPQTKSFGVFNYPINFEIINDNLLNLIVQNQYNPINSYYEISFGKSSLYLRSKYNLKNIYYYNYANNSFNIEGIIELLGDLWKEIYDRHLSKKPFNQYLNEKQIKISVKNQKQKLFSSAKKLLGYIILTPLIVSQNMGQNMQIINNANNDKQNIIINGDLDKNNDFNKIYQNFLKSFITLKDDNFDLSDVKNIQNYINLNLLINIPVFIIETKKLKYCFDIIKQFQNIMNDFSSYLSEIDIINYDLIKDYEQYSFINEEIIKYFKVQNINVIKKALLFINNKILFVFYPNQNYLLKVENYDYNKNTFNLKKFAQQKPIDNYQIFDTNNIIGSQQSQHDYNHTLGLENIGATCYMNATLQCLCNVSSLKEYFLNDSKYNQDVLTKPFKLAKCFADVLRKLWSQTYETYYAPREFKEMISQMNPLFKGIQANDSKDLVLFIFETIHYELNNPSQNPFDIKLENIPNELKLFRSNYYPQNYSIISKIFYYEQYSILQCKRCGFQTNNFNIMNMIIFPLEKVRLYVLKQNPQGLTKPNITIFDCFEQSEQPEMLEGSNQIFCNNCRLSSDASSCNKLYTCPEVLTIILNRGKGLEFEVMFSFPLELSIEKYVTDKSSKPNYELIGVLTHYGPSGMAGHFVAYCKSPINGEWYFYNDADVTHKNKINIENEMQSNGVPYILFYQRVKADKCIYFTYEGKEGFYEYSDDNKLLIDAYNGFRNKYSWAPACTVNFYLLKDNNMIDLEHYKSLRDNGINNEDKICVIIAGN